MLDEQKYLEGELSRAIARSETVSNLFVKICEDNATSKNTDEMFMQLSQRYKAEHLELKEKSLKLKERIAKIGEMKQNKDDFIKAVRKFMEMRTLKASMLREIIDHIDVHEKQGGNKCYTQKLVIYYRFVGLINIPMMPEDENYKADTRIGVEVE